MPTTIPTGTKLSALPTHILPDTIRVLCCTGHRSEETHNSPPDRLLNKLARNALQKYRPSVLISGMALGWDLAMAEEALKLRIPLVAAIPFMSQAAKWRVADLARWADTREAASFTHYSAAAYKDGIYNARNRWMVENSIGVISLLDPAREESGTGYTVAYARQLRKSIMPMWSLWQTDLKRATAAKEPKPCQ